MGGDGTLSNDLVVAFTGARGAAYGVRLLEVLLSAGRRVHLVISPAGRQVLAQPSLVVASKCWANLTDGTPLVLSLIHI